jgi:hypothetical protein
MSLSVSEIASVVREVRPALVRGWVQKVFQPSAHTIVLEIRRVIMVSEPFYDMMPFEFTGTQAAMKCASYPTQKEDQYPSASCQNGADKGGLLA